MFGVQKVEPRKVDNNIIKKIEEIKNTKRGGKYPIYQIAKKIDKEYGEPDWNKFSDFDKEIWVLTVNRGKKGIYMYLTYDFEHFLIRRAKNMLSENYKPKVFSKIKNLTLVDKAWNYRTGYKIDLTKVYLDFEEFKKQSGSI